MVHRGMIPDIVTYNSLINGLCKMDNVQEAVKLFENLRFRGVTNGFVPNDVTWYILFWMNQPVLSVARGGHHWNWMLKPCNFEFIGNVAIIKSSKDTRYGLDSIVTHAGEKLQCWAVGH
ncbi:hypothetical protein OSB04_028076 [Centaurea solstitialis]|uniref:Pentatricopeptide repeat-containing protein n=1 Tax=Centaurea solstitialis TaxID=347529 RepID=A0AA38SSI0_9ASTR|nr:hypothetical protein OSB04_028076 [Centaurea solstitialis]